MHLNPNNQHINICINNVLWPFQETLITKQNVPLDLVKEKQAQKGLDSDIHFVNTIQDIIVQTIPYGTF